MWLIDANRLYDAAEEKYMEDRSKTENVIARAMLSDARRKIQMLIAYAPSVDAIPVVRCKDCKYYRNHPNGLCYLHTEPKENERGYSGEAVCVEPDDFAVEARPNEQPTVCAR